MCTISTGANESEFLTSTEGHGNIGDNSAIDTCTPNVQYADDPHHPGQVSAPK